MRRIVSLAAFIPAFGLLALSVSACDAAHTRGDDAGPGADAPALADAFTPTDTGGLCPPGLEPYTPMAPANRCTVEGARCTGGSDSVCGAGLFCECRAGYWSCAVAEPDPACYCGREPDPGSPCTVEGDSCGACCPTPGTPSWGPFLCTGGRWEPLACPPIECPPLTGSCPAELGASLGLACGLEGQLCGNPCCESIQCTGGVWGPGPAVGCACDPSSVFTCGAGSCTTDRACVEVGCETRCDALPEGCTSCACAVVPEGGSCRERDGHVYVTVGDCA
jgi:hypothetical protein